MIHKDFIVFENGVIAYGIKNPKTKVCGIKVGYIKLFWSTPLSPTINIYPIHKIGGNVFRHINCKKKGHSGDGFIPIVQRSF